MDRFVTPSVISMMVVTVFSIRTSANVAPVLIAASIAA
jgi:hypothetical protein